MTGIKKYAYVDYSKPPMTYWASADVKVSSLRVRTITSKAKAASIAFVHRPIVEVGPAPSNIRALPAVPRGEGVHHKPKAKRKANEEETRKNLSIGYVSTMLSLTYFTLNVNNIHVSSNPIL